MRVDLSQYVRVEDKSKELQRSLSTLIGLKLVSARVFAASTWHFYFGPQSVSSDHCNIYLAVECPWRIHQDDFIKIGSEDYDELEGSSERQSQVIRALIGEDGLFVESVAADSLGGFTVGLSDRYVLDIFPASDNEMEWLFRNPSAFNLILMSGELSKRRNLPH
ncbi:MAG: hypothetical protein ACK5W1_03010 [Flavobacteriales bacterium]|jgi:hypothetical protein